MTASAMETHGMFSWFGHNSGAPARARAFYESVLGWTIETQTMPNGAAYDTIKIGGQPIAGIPAAGADGQAAWLPYITVDDVDARVKAAEAAGAAVVSPAVSVPGVGRMATIADPCGARVAFICYGG